MDNHPFALDLITKERIRQVELWGGGPTACESPHGNQDRRLRVLVEEVGEVARALNDREPDINLLSEVVQVAAVACAWIEGLYAEGVV